MKTCLNAYTAILLFALLSSLNSHGLSWRAGQAPLREHLYSVAYGEGLYVAVGNNRTILTSSNGVRWSVRMHNTNGHGWLCGVAQGNGTFVAVGNTFQRLYRYGPLASPVYWGPPGSLGFSSDTNAAPIVVSEDGIHWRPVWPRAGSLSAIAFGRGRFVAVGLGGVLTSSDGYSWAAANPVYMPDGTRRPVLMEDQLHPAPSQIAYGNGMFVVRSWRGDALVSTNGLDWFYRSMAATAGGPSLDLLGSGAGRFIAPGQGYVNYRPGQTLFTSRNGLEWMAATPPRFSVVALSEGPQTPAVVAGVDKTGAWWVQTSSNGRDWSGSATRIAKPIYGIGFGHRGFIAVGANGFILRSIAN